MNYVSYELQLFVAVGASPLPAGLIKGGLLMPSLFAIRKMLKRGLVCSECDHHFKATLDDIMFSPSFLDEVYLLCPNCKKRSMCYMPEIEK